MGSYTVDVFNEELRFAIGGARMASTAITPARILRWLNATYLWVSQPNIFDHPELQTVEYIALSSTTNEYATVNEFRGYNNIFVTDTTTNPPPFDSKKYPLDPEDIRELDTVLITPGRPSQYAAWGRNIHLDRAADSTWNGRMMGVRGRIKPTKLVADSHTTLLADDWDHLISIGGQVFAWNALGVPDMAMNAREDFGRLINDMLDIGQHSQTDTLMTNKIRDPFGPMGPG